MYESMPSTYKLQTSNLTSIVFARDPMSRLVSAWKDKIDRVYGHQYYYKKFTRHILAKFNPGVPIPAIQKDAADKGLKVSFKQFLTWISQGGFHKADTHWTPVSFACNGNFHSN